MDLTNRFAVARWSCAKGIQSRDSIFTSTYRSCTSYIEMSWVKESPILANPRQEQCRRPGDTLMSGETMENVHEGDHTKLELRVSLWDKDGDG